MKVFCTRPHLIAKLKQNGVKVEKVENPFNENHGAWEFENTDKARKIAQEYYKEIGRPVPPNLQ